MNNSNMRKITQNSFSEKLHDKINIDSVETIFNGI